MKKKQKEGWRAILGAIGICFLFFAAYSILSIVRHNHYHSFGYDLGINDQVVWKYSKFQLPINTIHPFPDKTKLATHIELVYALIAPFYWIWSSRKMLLLIEVFFLCSSGMAVFLLTRHKGFSWRVGYAVLVGYLSFYGVQHALWFDVHSSTFAAAFLAWFIYALETKRARLSVLFFLLAITAKENIALITLVISGVQCWVSRDKKLLFYAGLSIAYLLFVYGIYFPYIVQQEYLYQNSAGLLSNLNPISLVDTSEKRTVIGYAVLTFGFVPLLAPLYLLPALAHIFTFFVIASELPGAQGIYMHYRVTLAPLLAWATVVGLGRVRNVSPLHISLYLLFWAGVAQYTLHLPLSYLSKEWFWQESPGVSSINRMITEYLPTDASVVSQNNITPHISQRDKIYTLFPEKKTFPDTSVCGEAECDYFRWAGEPEYLIVDFSSEWDARHLLTDRGQFVLGVGNLEKTGEIVMFQEIGTTKLYKIRYSH